MAVDSNELRQGTPPASGKARLPEISELGKYVIEKRIGAGGMGAVFLARDRDLKRLVALKVLPKDKAQNPTLVKRFRAEAQAAAQLRHENIVTVYESGEADGYLFIAMEYVDGADVHDLIVKRGRLPVKRSLEIMKQVAAALQHAYEQNIVHRDIKPSNLLIRRDGMVKLTDLGLARSVDETLETGITRAGTTVGTVDYMSPEQARSSKAADIRSDLYSLGCTWFHMLTGHAPFPDGSLTNKLQAHAINPPPDPRSENENVTEAIVAVIHRLMAKKPEARYQTPRELLDDLSQPSLLRSGLAQVLFDDAPASSKRSRRSTSVEADEEDDAPQEESRGPRRNATRNESAKRAPQLTPLDQWDEEEDEDRPSTPAARRSQRRSLDVDDEVEDEDETESTPRPGKRKSARPDETASTGSSKRSTVGLFDDDPAEDEADEPAAGGRKAKAASSKASGKSAPPKVMPPKLATAAVADDSDEPKGGIPWDLLRNVAIIAGLLVALGGVGVLVTQYGDQLGFGNAPPPRPAENLFEPSDPSGKSATAGGPAPGQIAGQPGAESVDGSGKSGPDGATMVEARPDATNPAAAATIVAATPNNTAPFDPDKRPDWFVDALGLANLPVYAVLPSQVDRNFPDLATALQAVSGTGGVIRLQGGVHRLSGISLPQNGRIAIVGDGQQRASIILGSVQASLAPGIVVPQGSLHLEDVDLFCDRSQLSPALGGDVDLIRVERGDLFVRRCSVTVVGPASTDQPTVVVFAAGTSANPHSRRVVLDHTFVRGQKTTALRLMSAKSDVFIDHCLAVGTEAPLLHLAAATVPTAGSAVSNASSESFRPANVLRLRSSTFVAPQRGLLLTASGQPAPTAIAVSQCLWTSHGSAEATLFDPRNWPEDATRGPQDPRFQNLRVFFRKSAVVGFPNLVQLAGESPLKVAEADTWQRIWSEAAPGTVFKIQDWPAGGIDEHGLVSYLKFDPVTLPEQILPGSSSYPGCGIDQVSLPAATAIKRALANLQRPIFPIETALAGERTLSIDAARDDLGATVNRAEVPAGGTLIVEVRGIGQRSITPVKVSGYRLIINVVPQDHSVLTLTVDGNRQLKAGGDPEGLFTVEQGTLEIRGANLLTQLTARPGLPRYLVAAKDATVILRDCDLRTGPAEVNGVQGLVRWQITGSGNGPTPQLVIEDSALLGAVPLVHGELQGGELLARNSLFASRGHAWDVKLHPTAERSPGQIDLRNCTFSSPRSSLRLVWPAAAVTGAPPLRIFVDRTVFGAPPPVQGESTGNSTILSQLGADPGPQAIEWWGDANAIASELDSWLKQENATADSPQAGVSLWQTTWGAEHETRLLAERGGVKFAEALSTKWGAGRPRMFQLHPDCKGAKWANGARPVGFSWERTTNEPAEKGPGDKPDKPSASKKPDKKKPDKPQPMSPVRPGISF